MLLSRVKKLTFATVILIKVVVYCITEGGKNMSIAENLKRIRKEKGLTQKTLGKLCGMSEAMIRQYELGYRTPKSENLKKMATALGCPISDIDETLFLIRRVPYFTNGLHELRLEHGLTQKELAKELHVEEQNISSWENGEREPYFHTIEKIADYFGTSLLYLYYGNEKYRKGIDVNDIEATAQEKAIKSAPHFTDYTNGKEALDYPLPYKPPEFTDASTPFISQKPLEKRHTITVNTETDKTHPVNIALKKLEHEEKLTPEERTLLGKQIKKATKSVAQTIESLKSTFSSYYALLNEAGQLEADRQINEAIERATQQAKEQVEGQIGLLTKIPEYRKTLDNPPQD